MRMGLVREIMSDLVHDTELLAQSEISPDTASCGVESLQERKRLLPYWASTLTQPQEARGNGSCCNSLVRQIGHFISTADRSALVLAALHSSYDT